MLCGFVIIDNFLSVHFTIESGIDMISKGTSFFYFFQKNNVIFTRDIAGQSLVGNLLVSLLFSVNIRGSFSQ